jgi:hypothetical protein
VAKDIIEQRAMFLPAGITGENSNTKRMSEVNKHSRGKKIWRGCLSQVYVFFFCG